SAATMLLEVGNRLQLLRLIRRYDQDRNESLSASELGWDQSRFQRLDADGDGRLTVAELEHLNQGEPDLELSTDVLGSDNDAVLQVLHSAADRRSPLTRPDMIRLSFGKTTVSFSYRPSDPAPE